MKTKAIFVGIDPGLTGAIGIMDDTSRPIAVFDISTRRRDTKETVIKMRFDALPTSAQLAERMAPYRDHELHGWVEEPFMSPGKKKSNMSITSLFQSYGGLLAMLELQEIEPHEIKPSVWKRAFQMNKQKGYSLEVASQLWPTLGLNQAQYHNRAEAMLIAEYGRLKWHQERQFSKEKP